jgi:hypothetical protein
MGALHKDAIIPSEIDSSDETAPGLNPHDQKTRIAAAAIADGLCSAAEIDGYELGAGNCVADAIIQTASELPDIAIEVQHEHKEKDIVGTTKNYLRCGLNVIWVAAKDSSERSRIRTELAPHMSNSPSVTVINDQTVELGDILNIRDFDYRVESLDEIGIKPALYRIEESVFSAYRTAEQLCLSPVEGLIPVWSAAELRKVINRGAVERLSSNGSLTKI